MPDGRSYIEGPQIIYRNITRKFAGNYICEGSNGPGATARDSLKVNVLRELKISDVFSVDN